MKKVALLVLLLQLLEMQYASAVTSHFDVTPKDIHDSYIVKKIWLDRFVLPQITLSEIAFTGNAALPKNAVVSDPDKFRVTIGMERKRPFAIVRIPAYKPGDVPGSINQVSSFALSVTEEPVKNNNVVAKAPTVTTSALATGTWHKIAITQTGFYKIDNAFIKSIGMNPSNVNPANIRVFGNGGRMLSEDNASPRKTDLPENAVWVNSNGDNTFDNEESVIFYAQGPMAWNKDSSNQRFIHVKNIFTDTAYYFLSFDNGSSLQIAMQTPPAAPNVTVASYNYYDVHDNDLVNPAGAGKMWYGEQFSSQLSNTTQRFSFDAGAPVTCAYCKVSFASTSATGGCSYEVALNNSSIGADNFPNATSLSKLMNLSSISGTGACGAKTIGVEVRFTPTDGTSIGYLDYIEINARRSLSVSADQFAFRDWQSVGQGNIAGFNVANASSNTRVFDVTDPQLPVLMNGSLNGNTYIFSREAERLREFAVTNSTNLFTPKYEGTVPNQNLHGMPQADLIIVTCPAFTDQANELADYHRQHDNMRVNVATTSQVYNEFSSGGQDISAIRDFVKMFYDRAGNDSTQLPRYLLLFGSGSYDYKNRLPDNHNLVPVFESTNSTDEDLSFSTDDFFGFLDDNENIENSAALNVLDIGVGRLPARNTTDATNLITKIKSYNTPSALGPWRIKTTIVADDGCNDGAGNFLRQSETMAGVVTSVAGDLYNHGKVYLDAIPLVSTPAGTRSPVASSFINNQVNLGTFWINYIGHGNPEVWAGERILTQDDYSKWNNANKLPFMVTGTCDFGQFDHPQFVSAGEQLVLRKEGGAIVNLTTTKAVYSDLNNTLIAKFLDALFTRQSIANGRWQTFGDAVSLGKNETFVTATDPRDLANFRKFVLLGDPALSPTFPNYNIAIDSVIDEHTGVPADTIKALGAYTLKGSVRDRNGSTVTGFDGLLYTSFFDKQRTVRSITGCNDEYQIRDNLIYKGKASVKKGMFSFTFITPKDINYNFGAGKISTYAENGITDAAGMDTSVKIGGFSENPVLNTVPPVVSPYINDSLFLNGGITGTNTSLYVSFYSKTGINISGNTIGHDINAVLDGDAASPYVLNDYYETAPNTFQSGSLSFPISGLANGRHSITVQAWDVNNNTGKGTVDFMVIDGSVVAIQQLMNYPNPFSDYTNFVFEHNHPDEELSVQVHIFTVSGSPVKTIQKTLMAAGRMSSEITWDGTDNNDSRLPSGIYIYRLDISTGNDYKSSAFQKLVITR